MKKLKLLVIAWMFTSYAYGQYTGNYTCKIDISIKDGFGNASNDCTNNFSMTANYSIGGSVNEWNQDLNTIGNSWKTYSKTLTIDGSVRLNSLKFKGIREFKKSFPFFYTCNAASASGEEATTDMPTDPTFEYPFSGIPSYDNNVTVKVSPNTVNMYYLTAANVVDNVNKDFPSEHTATIKAYPDAPYTWEYEKTTGNWIEMPAAFQNLSTIQVKGYDLFTEAEFLTILKNNANVRFRVKYEGTVKRTFTVFPKLSAPRITGVEPIMESCFGSNDAQLKICFSRAMYTGELLNIELNGAILNGQTSNISSLDAGHCFTVSNLTPISYAIALLGTYDVDGNADVDATYTGSLDHKASSGITPRTAITNFIGNTVDVHCYGGEDGKIAVSAQGGTGIYTTYLVLGSDTVQQMPMNESAAITFTDLKAGDYVVWLKDSKGCDPKETDGSIKHLDLTIGEPAQKVFLSTVEAIEPLGFGHSDGYITVRSDEGTSPYTFEWKDNNDNPLIPETSVLEGSSMTSRLSGIAKGLYHVRSQDVNYALTFPQTETNLRGCYDTLTIELDQPPLLEISVDEYHFVSCNGYDDGEIVAHAIGGRSYFLGHPYHPYQYEWYVVNGGSLTAFGTSDSIATERPSAVYRVKVTDRNGIIAWSPDFKLIQPDVLKINFVTSELLCNGDTNGTSKAIVQGGTTAYKYTWSTEETTNEINNLADGWYSLIVTDARSCTTYGQTEVKVPNSLKAEAVLDYPTCNGYADGSIELTVGGGRAPFTYVWDHGASTSAITNLGEDEYHVRIADANDCFITRDYTLQDPDLSPVDLGPDRVLCKDQSLDLDITRADISTQYSWLKDGTPFASTAVVQLVDAAVYHLKISDSNGCINEDEVKVERNDSEIAASITVATRAQLAGKVRVANISFPAPDKVEWIIPQEATVLEKTPGYLDISFSTKGEYSIGLTSFKGSCEKTTYSTVRIVDKSELTDYQTPDEPYIKQFMVTPNPNDGRFVATVELREVGDFILILHTTQGNVLTQQDVKGQSFAKVDFDVSSMAGKGVYVLQLVTSQGYSTFKIVIQ